MRQDSESVTSIQALLGARNLFIYTVDEASPEASRFNSEFAPFQFVGMGGESIVFQRDNRYVVSLFRQTPDPEEINHFQQMESVSAILHTLFPENFPKIRLFVWENPQDQEEILVGTIRQSISHTQPENVQQVKELLVAKIEFLQTLGIHSVMDSVTNIVMETKNQREAYIDLVEVIGFDTSVDSSLQVRILQDAGYNEQQIQIVMQSLLQLKELRARAFL